MLKFDQDKVNILLDLGANNGCSVRKFSKILETFNLWSVYCFEPGSVSDSKAMLETLKDNSNVKLIKRPVSSCEKNILFYEHKNNSSASTTWSKKANDNRRPGDCGSNIKGDIIKKELLSVDIVKFIKELNKKNNNNTRLVIKCDIEGEEYNIIPKMLDNNIFLNVSHIYLEWHEEWRPSNPKYWQSNLIKQIKKQNSSINIDSRWNALGW